jgi:regulator of sigma E protease
MLDLARALTVGGWILATVVAFGAMIFVHELGHFLLAKRLGVIVHAFALGFGPKLFSFRRNETTYALNAVPFGGYVRMAGEDFDDSEAEAGSFRRQPVWARIAIVAAGPVMNLLMAVLILAVLAMGFGVPVATNRVEMLVTTCGQPPADDPEAPCPATAAGLRAGDAIVAINGTPMDTGMAVVEAIHASPGRPLRLTVERDGRRFEVVVTPRLDPVRKIGLIGFSPALVRQRYNPLTALVWGVRWTGEFVANLAAILVALVRERALLQNLGGPVAAATQLVAAGRSGLENFLFVAAQLSIIIGIFNFIPIPALDGGRLAFLLTEALRRRPVDPRREGYIHLVGFMLLILLLVFLTAQDIGRLLLRRT